LVEPFLDLMNNNNGVGGGIVTSFRRKDVIDVTANGDLNSGTVENANVFKFGHPQSEHRSSNAIHSLLADTSLRSMFLLR
jgi:hypothetical protein